MAGVINEDKEPAASEQGVSDESLDAYRRQLQPKVLSLFGDDDLSSIPRPELALRIGNLLTYEIERSGTKLGLLQRRKLVTGLIDWLLQCNAMQPEERQELMDSAPVPQAQPGAVTPPEGQDRTKATSHSPTVTAAKNKVHPLVMERLDVSAASQLPREDLTRQIGEIVREIVVDEKLNLNGPEQQSIVDIMLDDMLGLGPLEPLLADEAVTDIMVNGPKQVYVERRGKLELTDVTFQNDEHVLNIARRIVSQIGRRVDETTPLVDARLMDGSRVNIIIPPLAIDGPSISIRKFSKKGITLDVMQRQNNISPAMATVMKIAARSRLNILISGGTGSGKTTLLNAMSQLIDPGERIVTIEDAAELQLQQPHVVRLETRPPNLEGSGEITMRDLVKNSLRMRPDRIILGEVRGAEAVDMLQAMNTGHDGSLGTLHANRPREALTRLENMIGLAGINLPAKAVRTQIASAIDMIVQVSRMRDGMRRVTHVEEIVGMEGEIITTQNLFTYEFQGEGKDGLLLGNYKSSGLRPHFTPKAAYFSLDKPLLEAMG
ncbi:CpaF family protein [Pelagibius marinus]|uniref:CpaF family protein n=1 Tax=Pelagibius marinus TaxID=2762760 RepID=UPI0029CA3EBE|nr:CpaF family protein [Pelagibius marinus]